MTSAIQAQLSRTTILALSLRCALLSQRGDQIDSLQPAANPAERVIELFHRARLQNNFAALFEALHSSAFLDPVVFPQCGRTLPSIVDSPRLSADLWSVHHPDSP